MTDVQEKVERQSLLEAAEELGVLVCEVPIAHGPLKGSSARGTRTGYTRHRNVGHKGDAICADCREFHNAYVREWLRAKREVDQDRIVHAVLSDGAEVVRYRKAKAWYLERGDSRQKVSVSDAAGVIANDVAPEYRRGLEGSAGLEKLLPQRVLA